jgi:hypothetical protein
MKKRKEKAHAFRSQRYGKTRREYRLVPVDQEKADESVCKRRAYVNDEPMQTQEKVSHISVKRV